MAKPIHLDATHFHSLVDYPTCPLHPNSIACTCQAELPDPVQTCLFVAEKLQDAIVGYDTSERIITECQQCITLLYAVVEEIQNAK